MQFSILHKERNLRYLFDLSVSLTNFIALLVKRLEQDFYYLFTEGYHHYPIVENFGSG